MEPIFAAVRRGQPHSAVDVPTNRGWAVEAVSAVATVAASSTSGIIALWVALRLCGRVRLYGFGNESHAWNCPVSPGSAPTCSKYFRANVDGLVSHHSVRQSCGKWWKFAPYVAESGRFHDLPMEWGWIQELLRQGRIEAPGCDVRGAAPAFARLTRFALG